MKDSKPWYWLREPRGDKSVSATLVFFSFWITAVSYALSSFEKVGSVSFRQFDAAACSSFLIPVLTLYFSRKFTQAKFDNKQATSSPAGQVVPPPFETIPPP